MADKQKYSAPKLLVIECSMQDVVTTSGGDNYFEWNWGDQAEEVFE